MSGKGQCLSSAGISEDFKEYLEIKDKIQQKGLEPGIKGSLKRMKRSVSNFSKKGTKKSLEKCGKKNEKVKKKELEEARKGKSVDRAEEKKKLEELRKNNTPDLNENFFS